MTVHFIGAGPGAPDLITVRGRELIARCPVCLYAGSIVPAALLACCPPGARVVDTAPLSLDEIVTNVISYGYSDHEEHHIDVTLRSGQGMIEVSVVDDGKPFNPLEFRTPDLKCPIDERPIGGLGIYLVKNYMNELEYKRTGIKNCLIMRKRF